MSEEPKNAGCSVNKALYGRAHLGHHKAKDVKKYYPGIFEELPSFAIIRDPESRFISAYRFMKSGGTEEVPVQEHVTTLLQDTDVNQFVETEIQDGIHVVELDYVFQRQSDFVLDDDGNQIVGKLFTLSELEKAWAFASDVLSRPVKPTYANKTKITSDLYEQALTIASATAIQNIYKEDYKLFDRVQSTSGGYMDG